MVVAGAGRDDSQRSIRARQSLQCVGDHPVTADDDQCIRTLVDRGVQQATCVVGVAADDCHDIDATLLQSRDRFFGGVRCVSVSRRRIGQQRHPANLAGHTAPLSPASGRCPHLIAALCIVAARGHGISLPGLRIPAGSSVDLTARNTCRPNSPTSSRIQAR